MGVIIKAVPELTWKLVCKGYLLPRPDPNKGLAKRATARCLSPYHHNQPVSHLQSHPHKHTTMADEMDVDVEQPKTKVKKEGKESGKPRFEVKKVSFHCHLSPPAWAETFALVYW